MREEILLHAHRTQSAHIGSCLSCVEILEAIFEVMRPEDHLMLGKGHAALAHMVATGHGEFFPHYFGEQEYMGSLGHALPVACGRALTGRRVYVLMGDGECDEGSVWEAMNFAIDNYLDVTLLIDNNGWQGCQRAKFRLPHFPLDVVNGHDKEQIKDALLKGYGPRAIVCRTIKGKGVSFMENDNEWHYRRLTDDDLARALEEVRSCDKP